MSRKVPYSLPTQPAPLPRPIVASYCTTFLKPEMLHIYRQITGLRRYDTFVICKERQSEVLYPMPQCVAISSAASG
jgi:hypothetical protein